MKISEIITNKYKLRMPPTVYYELLADVVEVEEEQEPMSVIDDIKAEIKEHTQRYTLSRESGGMGQVDWSDYLIKTDDVLNIIDKHISKTNCSKCIHSNEYDGEFCYMCVKGDENNFQDCGNGK